MKQATKPFGATWLAIFAAVVLLAQFTLVTIAQARPAGQMIELCSSHGVKKIFVPAAPDEQTPAPCSHCGHCIAPVVVMGTPASLAVESVIYPSAVVVHEGAVQTSFYAARAPPRPPSQAPPLS